MRKLIVLIFIIGFVGSASAAEVTYHFTAEIQSILDGAGIFSEWEGEYSVGTELKGTITYDPENVGILHNPDSNVPEPDARALPDAWGLWFTGEIVFENQGYDWLDNCGRYIKIQNSSSESVHEIKISTIQGSTVDPDQHAMTQVITSTIVGLDASMPTDLDLGNSAEYTVQITTADGPYSVFNANITAIMTSEEYNNSADQSVETAATAAEKLVGELCPCDNNWKNHGAYVRCVKRTARKLVKEGDISYKKKRAMVSEADKKTCGKKNKNKHKHKKKK